MTIKQFVMAYSCGKDSTLALHKMLEEGKEPVALITMVNEDADRSFFHGADRKMLQAYSEALGIPLLAVPAKGENYHLAMEDALRKAVEMGAEAACFGDIDIAGNRKWGEERCRNAKIQAVYPLWQKDRAGNVRELLRLGYKCLVKAIDNRLLPETLLGKIMDEDVMKKMEEAGVDICGENGEYHTLVVGGPIFQTPLPYRTGRILKFGDFSVVEVDVELTKSAQHTSLAWEEISTKHIIRNQWIDFRESTYRFPDGREIGPFYSYSRRDYVVIVASDEDGNYICVRQFRQGIKAVTTEFPAGGIERRDGREYRGGREQNDTSLPSETFLEAYNAAEDALAAAKRELREETGYESDEWAHLMTIPSNATIADNYAYLFTAKNCRKSSDQKLDETEFVDVIKHTAEEIEKLIINRQFQQAMHVMAWLLARQK